MNPLIFIAASLACFRLTLLITEDKIMDWLRRDVSKIGKRAKQGISCSFCVSFYWAFAITDGLWMLGYLPWQEIFFWLPAIWGASILWNKALQMK